MSQARTWQPGDVSAVVCTMNSIASIEPCLESLKEAGVGEIIVVDASSTDGTRAIADQLATTVLQDPGTGLGNARNIGIAETTKDLILNMGSDNVLPSGQLELMIEELQTGNYSGVSAQTRIEVANYPSKGLNAWRQGRFPPGPAAVIGTPTLFRGDLLRTNPFDSERVFSDDSELCERWTREFGATFAISRAEVLERGKTSWKEVKIRARMYGVSDYEIFHDLRKSREDVRRQCESILHPLASDLVTPVRRLPISVSVPLLPFFLAFTGMRYSFWVKRSLGSPFSQGH